MFPSVLLTPRITGWQWSAAELPVRVDAVVRFTFIFQAHQVFDYECIGRNN